MIIKYNEKYGGSDAEVRYRDVKVHYKEGDIETLDMRMPGGRSVVGFDKNSRAVMYTPEPPVYDNVQYELRCKKSFSK